MVIDKDTIIDKFLNKQENEILLSVVTAIIIAFLSISFNLLFINYSFIYVISIGLNVFALVLFLLLRQWKKTYKKKYIESGKEILSKETDEINKQKKFRNRFQKKYLIACLMFLLSLSGGLLLNVFFGYEDYYSKESKSSLDKIFKEKVFNIENALSNLDSSNKNIKEIYILVDSIKQLMNQKIHSSLKKVK